MTPLVSYVVTVFNKRPHLRQTLDNVRAQAAFAGQDIEIIAADDASTDGSLDCLKAEASSDPRIRVIANDRNAGPAIRINQAAAIARGTFLMAIDADDLLSRNGLSFFLDIATRRDAPLVFGEARRGLDCLDIPAASNVSIVESPLTYCATGQITHMGFLVATETWRAAGGADEAVFIQDQSLPLRLCAAAPRAAFVHAVSYWLRPTDTNSLSRDTRQQHHDRFLSAFHMLQRDDLPAPARRALARQAISALWKARRDEGSIAPYLSMPFARYVLNRALSVEPSDDTLRALADRLSTAPDIRRVSHV